jgi:hypothetical protein
LRGPGVDRGGEAAERGPLALPVGHVCLQLQGALLGGDADDLATF